jgi:hypothetical protein
MYKRTPRMITDETIITIFANFSSRYFMIPV